MGWLVGGWVGRMGRWVSGLVGGENGRNAWKIVRNLRICESVNDFHVFWAGGVGAWVGEGVQKTRDVYGKSCKNAESARVVRN